MGTLLAIVMRDWIHLSTSLQINIVRIHKVLSLNSVEMFEIHNVETKAELYNNNQLF